MLVLSLKHNQRHYAASVSSTCLMPSILRLSAHRPYLSAMPSFMQSAYALKQIPTYRLICRASDDDLMWASLGATPFYHVPQDSPLYANLVRISAPNWALHFKAQYA